MINLIKIRSNDSQCKNNSNREQTHSIHTLKKKKSTFSYNFKPNINQKNCLILLFTIFSIVMPIGIQPQLQANNAFAETSQTINNEVDYSHGGKKSSNSSNSETISKSNVYAINPFDSSIDDENKGAKMDIIIPDMAGPNTVSETQPGSTTNTHESGAQSSGQFKPNSLDKDSSDIDDIDSANDTINKEQQNPETSELHSTQLQINAVNNNSVDKNIDDVNNSVADDVASADNTETKLNSQPIYESYLPAIDNRDANKSNADASIPGNAVNINNSVDNNIDATRNPATDDVPTADNTKTKLNSQPIYESYLPAIDNRDANKSIDGVIMRGNKVDTEITSMNSSMNPDIGNDTGNADTNLVRQENQPTTTNQSEFTGSQFELDSQPKYRSYRDYIENSNASKDTNIDNTSSTKSTIEPSSATAASSQVTAQSSSKVYGDFNGDGRDDLAIGVPGENEGAGAVNVIYGSSNGLSATSPRDDQFWTQSSPDVNDDPQSDDAFGSSLASGDFNGDGKDDLAIGVPDEDLGSISDVGAVEVIYGSSSGLSASSPRTDQFWTQDSADVNDGKEVNDNFGSSLSPGDFNGDGRDDLAIGVPGENDNAGAVNVLYGSPSGLSATSPRSDQFWTQSTTDVNDVSEVEDHFGSSLTSGDFNGDGRDDLSYRSAT